ncbi:Hypothetical predicted protein [Mytilus galloprovincialis]|uniref:ParB/Sulfiredoxin domain-containing protein n=1 Tax=Mytilus galloprovincialis TaxID=29158 RepID=A0A8B6GX12_MYTGA|nr:Hypothetical predicted protein [Mytilus galloprovincialis]
MDLRPSEIYFSQAEINSRFDQKSRHCGKNIGETLDELMEGRCSISDIPTISVMWRGGKWVTADNRRLWVFRHLEKLRKCTTIYVRETHYINPKKLNSINGGRTVKFYRGKSATGRWHHQVSSIDPDASLATYSETSNQNVTRNPYTTSSLSMLRTLTSYDRRSPQRDYSNYSNFHAAISNLSLSTSRNVERLDPLNVRYTKETITINSHFENLKLGLRYSVNGENVDAITVYKVFGKYWVTDGNKRLWAYKEARSSNIGVRIQVKVKEDKEEFLELMRKDRPWLSLIDILQSGENIQILT